MQTTRDEVVKKIQETIRAAFVFQMVSLDTLYNVKATAQRLLREADPYGELPPLYIAMDIVDIHMLICELPQYPPFYHGDFLGRYEYADLYITDGCFVCVRNTSTGVRAIRELFSLDFRCDPCLGIYAPDWAKEACARFNNKNKLIDSNFCNLKQKRIGLDESCEDEE